MTRVMRAVGQEIRVLTMLMTALSVAEDEATFGAGTLSRIFRLGLLGVAGAVSIGAAVQVTQQGNIIPVGQTLPGQARKVTATGIAQIDVGEYLLRPGAGGVIPTAPAGPPMAPAAGRSTAGGNQFFIGPVEISNEGLPPDQAWERTKNRVRSLAFPWPR
jgi:hypothetical protein